MIYVLDTHALVWHLAASPRLSPSARAILATPDSSLVVPSIVLAEIWHLYHRRRISISPTDVRAKLLNAGNCVVYPLDEMVLDMLPPGLEIHDAIIVATTLVHRDVLVMEAKLVTADAQIIQSRLVETLW